MNSLMVYPLPVLLIFIVADVGKTEMGMGKALKARGTFFPFLFILSVLFPSPLLLPLSSLPFFTS